jgi:REP element-mobilizing transposase RayT
MVERTNRPILVFVTVCSHRRKPIFATPATTTVILDAWRQADAWRIGRYVIMPDHVHFFCAPSEREIPLTRWVPYWKYVATRSWTNREDLPIWQRHFWDTQLRSNESYSEKWEYVRENPVRHRLVSKPEAWPYAGELNVLSWDE